MFCFSEMRRAFSLQIKHITRAAYLFGSEIIIILLATNTAIAAFSSFVVITPENEAKHPFLIQSQPVENQADLTRIRVIGPVDGHKKVWLIMCKRSLRPASQNFRSSIWENTEDSKGIVSLSQLKPGLTTLPESGSQQYAYVEVVLSSDEMRRSYLYIDHPVEVRDGGYYYSIDLAYYLTGPLGKKSLIQWE